MKSKADVSDATEAFLLCEDMLVQSYKDWIDRERECMEIAEEWGVPTEEFTELWEGWRDKKEIEEWNARPKVEAKAEAEASLKNSAIQPSVKEHKIDEPKAAKGNVRWKQTSDGNWFYAVDGGMWRRGFGSPPKHLLKPTVELRVVEQGKPEPEPEEDEEAKKAAVDSAEAKPEALKVGLPAVTAGAGVAAADWDDAIAAMNRQHAIIENVGGKAVIASWEPSTTNPSKMVVVFQNKDSFLLRYSNRFVPVEVHTVRGVTVVRAPLGQWWLGHRGRQQYRGVVFRPAGDKVIGGCLNLWQGWGVEARAGDWGLIREHIREVIAGGNKEFADYIERWIAWAIQNPAAQAEVALVLIGLKGAGKGTLVRCLQRIFGAHAFQVTSREEVIGKFNGHLQDCVLFVADEAYWAATSDALVDCRA